MQPHKHALLEDEAPPEPEGATSGSCGWVRVQWVHLSGFDDGGTGTGTFNFLILVLLFILLRFLVFHLAVLYANNRKVKRVE